VAIPFFVLDLPELMTVPRFLRGMVVLERRLQPVPVLRCLPGALSRRRHDDMRVVVAVIAMGAVRMQERGFQPGWGLGRHVIGSNFFYYMRDPWGSFAEYFHDLDYIPESCAWEARDWPESDALYRWGPPVPDDFGLNREVEG